MTQQKARLPFPRAGLLLPALYALLGVGSVLLALLNDSVAINMVLLAWAITSTTSCLAYWLSVSGPSPDPNSRTMRFLLLGMFRSITLLASVLIVSQWKREWLLPYSFLLTAHLLVLLTAETILFTRHGSKPRTKKTDEGKTP